jgi:hypothetical protein
MSPARTTILGNMLVSHVGQIVDPIDIIPREVHWKILNMLQGLVHDILGSSKRIPLLLARCRWIYISQVLFSEFLS